MLAIGHTQSCAAQHQYQRVDEAAGALGLEGVVEASLVAGNAGVDLVAAPLGCLRGSVKIFYLDPFGIYNLLWRITFLTNSGSASKGRAMETMSILPLLRILRWGFEIIR